VKKEFNATNSTVTGNATNWQNLRKYRTSDKLDYHVDGSDVVGLLCLKTAKGGEGGVSRIVSTVAVYNRLLQTHPDLIPLLYSPTPQDMRGDFGIDWFYQYPCRYYNGVLRTHWNTEYFLSAYRYPTSPYTDVPKDLERLIKVYDEIANSPEFTYEMDLQVGDIQLINNHLVSIYSI
jgi:hypothetical protein